MANDANSDDGSQKMRAGLSVPEDERPETQYPERSNMTSFRVRQRGYLQSSEKGATADPMYALFARDLFVVPQKQFHIGESIELPQLPSEFANDVGGVPPYLIVNIMLPNYDPSMLTTKVDGPGWLYVFYFILNETTRTQLADLDTAPAAVRVLSKFINTDSVAFRERLKLIACLLNLDELKFNSVVKRAITDYNMKPFLTRPQHKFFRGDNYFEMDVDVHDFGYIPKKMWASLKERVPEFVLDWGITIEGRDDEELPEVVMACARVDKYGLENAIPLSESQALSDLQRVKEAETMDAEDEDA